MTYPVTSDKIRHALLAASISMCLAVPAHADDIDVYLAQSAANQKPNILFVLDYSGSMNDNIYGGRANGANPSKIDILKEAMRKVLDENMDRVNAGVGSLYSSTTTGIRWPISELNADASTIDPDIPIGSFTVKDIITQQIEERDAGGWTATVDALAEAAQYFKGDAVTHNDAGPNNGLRHEPHRWNVNKQRYDGGNDLAALAASYSPSNAYATDRSVTYYCNDFSAAGGPNYCENKLVSNCSIRTKSDTPTTGFERQENLWGNYQRCEYQRTMDWMGARYNTPITQSCQANKIILISDGEPTRVNDGATLRSVLGTGLSGCEDLSTSIFRKPAGTETDGNCGPEILRSLANNDQNPAIPGSTVETYTVGFNISGPGQDYLTLLAEAGNGKFYKADTPQELAEALSDFFDKALGGSENFAELSIDVDKASFAHDNRAFFSLFTPSIRRSWNGNLKGYFVERTGLADINGLKATVVTENGEQFANEAQSFWSGKADGNEVSKGGASEQLLKGTRKLYTYTGDDIPPGGAALAGVANNRLVANNKKISFEMMGLPKGSKRRDSALNWIQNAPMGDPLHSKSVSVNYGSQQVVYVMTNQGLLHAFDATTPVTPNVGDDTGGEELFAFMPQVLLRNLPDLEENRNTGGHIYGLDGKITRWHTDTNNDGIVDNGEQVLLILGMRRGGDAYFALDVSKPDAPRLKWKIDGSHADFPRLAQSWSRMSLVNVMSGGTNQRVLAFGAGYDAAVQDPANSPVSSRGNAIYMVDQDGNLVWKVDSKDNASMQYSIASDLTIIDSDSDGLADRLYVGDVGGQLWRIDFDDIKDSPSVTLLANLDDGNHQPFFYPPSVALNRDAKGDYLSISIGSGNRTNPLLADTRNHLYMIRDKDLDKGAPAAGFKTVRTKDLFDATTDSISSSDATKVRKAQTQLDKARGWHVALAANEKALSSLVTFEGKLLATTFEADLSPDPTICGFDTIGRFYLMDVANGAPADALGDSVVETEQGNVTSRSRTLNSSGIPSSPVVVFPKGSGVVQVIVDKETVNLINQRLSRVYWHAR